MIKKEIYPKTIRLNCKGNKVEITEKLDGSNLCIFKKNDELYVAQRKNIINIDNELEESKTIMYKGLYQWIIDNKDKLKLIRNDSVICCEWIGMGQIKYDVSEFDKRLYMFAKANIDNDFNLYNIRYEHDLFIYPFENNEIINCIGIVPMAYEMQIIPTKEQLDKMYAKYCDKTNRKVEGFVINYNNQIQKYVRMKNGKLQEHFDREELIN